MCTAVGGCIARVSRLSCSHVVRVSYFCLLVWNSLPHPGPLPRDDPGRARCPTETLLIPVRCPAVLLGCTRIVQTELTHMCPWFCPLTAVLFLADTKEHLWHENKRLGVWPSPLPFLRQLLLVTTCTQWRSHPRACCCSLNHRRPRHLSASLCLRKHRELRDHVCTRRGCGRAHGCALQRCALFCCLLCCCSVCTPSPTLSFRSALCIVHHVGVVLFQTTFHCV